MNTAFFVMLGVAAIIVASGIAKALETAAKTRREQASAVGADEVSTRLDELESRLRDVLDVMIAMSEKMDRWEREGVPAGSERKGAS